jgi:hypothetical protein
MADNRVHTLHPNNITHAPDIDTNLLSLATLFDLRYEISMRLDKGGNIYKDSMLVANTIRDGKLFQLKTLQ